MNVRTRSVVVGSALLLMFMMVSLIAPADPVAAATRTQYPDRISFEASLDAGHSLTDDYSPASGYPAGFGVYNNATMSAFFGETDYESTGFNNLNIIQSSETYCSWLQRLVSVELPNHVEHRRRHRCTSVSAWTYSATRARYRTGLTSRMATERPRTSRSRQRQLLRDNLSRPDRLDPLRASGRRLHDERLILHRQPHDRRRWRRRAGARRSAVRHDRLRLRSRPAPLSSSTRQPVASSRRLGWSASR